MAARDEANAHISAFGESRAGRGIVGDARQEWEEGQNVKIGWYFEKSVPDQRISGLYSVC